MESCKKIFTLLFLICIGCSGNLTKEIEAEYSALPDYIDYNFHIKPILSDACYTCHGPDPESRKAGLRLDIEEEAFKKLESGNHAIVKGNTRKSAVLKRLLSEDPDKMMPPPDSENSLSNRDIAMISKWIEQGSEFKEHWAFFPIEEQKTPDIESDWSRINEIDHFIQQKLVEQNLTPSKVANKEHLIKRLTMDLTGLLPTIEEIDTFLNDDSEDAYEKVVDRLFQTDAFAERMAMEWMDVARYADSHGVSFDGYRTSWPFRDWLIEAFKRNMSYKDFITHQLAGDLIENSDKESKIATAFLRMGPLEASAGSIPEEFRIEYVNERASVVGNSLLGLTLECAKCHDHKFDPITQKEFFQISAFFNTTEEFGLAPTDADRAPTLLLLDADQEKEIDSLLLYLNTQELELQSIKTKKLTSKQYIAPLPKTAVNDHVGYFAFNTIKPYKKEIKRRVNPEEEKKKKKKDSIAALKNKKKKKEEKKEPPKKIFVDMQMLDNNKNAEANLKITLTEGKFGKAAKFNEEYDIIKLRKVGEFEHTDPFSISTWINTVKDETGSSQTIIGNTGHVFQYHRGWDLALDSTNHVQVQMIHRLPDEIISLSSKNPIPANSWEHIGFTYDGSKSATGITIFVNGIPVEATINYDQLKRSIIPINEGMKRDSLPLVVGRSNRLWMGDLGLFQGAIDEIRIYDRQLSEWEMAKLGESEKSVDQNKLKEEHWYLYDNSLTAIKDSILETRKKIAAIFDKADELMVMEEMKTPRKTFLLKNGLYNQLGESVEPGGINKVLPYADSYPKNRLGLSEWLFDPKNPLVSRVAVNRYWQMIFGVGLVNTSENFGSQGARPTHPELLDWLASDFIKSDWDIRELLKKMVMSYTYRQSSFCEEEVRSLDPLNEYLARSPSYRWPAEMIRDNALKSSGLLVQKLGGPSVKPYQPDGLWKEVGGASNKLAKYVRDSSDNLYRRSMYTFARRFAPSPFLINFDATSREICIIRRDITSTPLQALTLLNDPQIIEASRVLTERVQKEKNENVREQLETAFRMTTGIRANDEQLEILHLQYQDAIKRFNENPILIDSILSVGEYPVDRTLSKKKIAAMTLVVSTIFNYDEFYMKR